MTGQRVTAVLCDRPYSPAGMDEETYVVRIYRRNTVAPSIPGAATGRRRDDRVALSGVIEDVEIGERRVFHDIGGLWEVLSRTTHGNSGSK